MAEDDLAYMGRALALAERGRGYVEPNPLVGAVVVSCGQVVGEGWHERYGEAHAELLALRAAGAAARGGDLYVTLEPCCHHGKTPPCTDAILKAGIRRVVAAMLDPFPAVSGQGVTRLRGAGLTVDLGAGEAAVRRLNAPYLKLLATGRPHVHAKWAMTLDGKIATPTGNSKWISNEASRRRVHELRGRMDALVVGRNTVTADDPLLTARPPGPRRPLRIVFSASGCLPLESKLVQTISEAPVLLATAASPDSATLQALHNRGVEVLHIDSGDPTARVLQLLDELGKRRLTNVLVEGGAGVLGSFLDAGQIDEVHVFIAPRLAGGVSATGPIGGFGVDKISRSAKITDWTSEWIESDVYVHGRVAGPDLPPG
jgi:diaminohydroxyphosphoribosylaminopyrimidine deaminase/5-amino-6-(5-phosphoribosylamino)uracil reductase